MFENFNYNMTNLKFLAVVTAYPIKIIIYCGIIQSFCKNDVVFSKQVSFNFKIFFYF